MIKMDSGNIASDYTHYGYITTDCKNVGEFITQAVEIYKNVIITIDDNCTYDFKGGEKVRITDDTEIESARYVDDTNPTTPLRIYIKTKPKPKYNVCSGWISIGYIGNAKEPCTDGRIFKTKQEAEMRTNNAVDIVRIEWKEEIK